MLIKPRLRRAIETELAELEPDPFQVRCQQEWEQELLVPWTEPIPPYGDAWDPEMSFMFHVIKVF